MARLSEFPQSALAAEDRPLLDGAHPLTSVLAHSSGALRAITAIGKWTRDESKLNPRLRELAVLGVASTVASPYAFERHERLALDAGVRRPEIDAIARGALDELPLDGLDRAALRAAEAIAQDRPVDDATFSTLMTHLPAEQVVDLVVVAAYYVAITRIITALDIGAGHGDGGPGLTAVS